MSSVPPTFKNLPSDDYRVANFTAEARELGGTVGVISAERGSYTAFWNMLMGALGAAPPETTCVTAMGVDVAGNTNQLCRRTKGDWLWIMGDDHSFGPGLLPRLLSHDVDVVIPHCLKRNPPWGPVVFTRQDEDGYFRTDDLPEDDLVEIHAGGSAGMLVRRHVLDAIGDPWFTPSPGSEGLNEDLHFCQKVREAGFRIYCDTGALLGHISHYTVWPRYSDGAWHIETEYDQETRIPIRRLEEVPA